MLALVAASIERFASEVRHLARTEVREVMEPFGRGQKGSSAMPHKRNPVVAERLCGLARIVRANALVGLENVALWHERDISHSSAERVILPDAFLALDYMLDRFTWLDRRPRRRCGSGCAAISTTRTASSSARGCCSPSSSPASSVTRPTGSFRPMRCAPGRTSVDFEALVAADPGDRPSGWDRRVWRRRSISRRAATRRCPIRAPRRAHSERGARSCLKVPSTSPAARFARSSSSTTNRLLLVASDRISVFDVVLPTAIPDKGRVLTGLSGFWFARTREIVSNHLLALRPDGRSTEARRLRMLPIECVVRGYLAGSGWKDYQRTGSTSGHVLPEGLRESDQLPEPIFTPATKAQTGHDENISRDQAADLVGDDLLRDVERSRRRALQPRGGARAGARHHPRRYEVRVRRGRRRAARPRRRGADARLVAFLAGGRYEPGRSQPSFDKQFVRDYAETLGWDKTDPGTRASGRRRRRHPRSLRRGVRASHRHRVRGVRRGSLGGAAVRVTVLVRPKSGILDPQGDAVRSSLDHLGFTVSDARVGRVIDLELEASSSARTRGHRSRTCAGGCSPTHSSRASKSTSAPPRPHERSATSHRRTRLSRLERRPGRRPRARQPRGRGRAGLARRVVAAGGRRRRTARRVLLR